MQTTHSEPPGPSTGLGAEGVTGVPGVSGGLGVKLPEVFGVDGKKEEDGSAGGISSLCCTDLQAPTRMGGGA